MAGTVERPVTGLECKLYYNANTYASPTWTLIPKAINVSFNISKDEGDQKSRSSSWGKGKGVHKNLEVSFTYRKKQGTDAIFDYLQAAALAGTVFELAVMDGATTVSGVQGIRAYCELMTFGDTQDLSSAEEVEFTAKPSYFEESGVEIDPVWYEIS